MASLQSTDLESEDDPEKRPSLLVYRGRIFGLLLGAMFALALTGCQSEEEPTATLTSSAGTIQLAKGSSCETTGGTTQCADRAVVDAPVALVRRGEIVDFDLSVSPSKTVTLEREDGAGQPIVLGSDEELMWEATGEDGLYNLSVNTATFQSSLVFQLNLQG